MASDHHQDPLNIENDSTSIRENPDLRTRNFQGDLDQAAIGSFPNVFNQHEFKPIYQSERKILPDTILIRNRGVRFNQKIKNDIELMCEDKVSRYKLEEVHCSLPSSVKSTFIMTFSPDGQRVASTHGDHRIYICDLNTGKLLDTLEGHPKTPWCLAWHPTNREILASGCLAGEVRVWDLRTRACESWTSENNTIITSLDFHPKHRLLVIATANDIHFWDWSESAPFAKSTTTHDKEKVKFVLFDSSGTKLITGISNLPKFAGHSSETLQHRIIDSYITHGSLDHMPTENMTQNSEIPTRPFQPSSQSTTDDSFNASNHISNHLNHHQPLSSSSSRQSGHESSRQTNDQQQDLNYRSTLTLYRVAFHYRQLEALEDSMRHTTFSPYVSSQQIVAPIYSNDNQTPNVVDADHDNNIQDTNAKSQSNSSNPLDYSDNKIQSKESPNQPAPSQGAVDNQTQSADQTTNPVVASSSTPSSSVRAPLPFEPVVVSFDESLEQLQLLPLVVDGQTINIATVIAQYPIELPYQLHHMMQFESINQVNQNFIRISKLMSSVRLYRQIVQQILSSNSGRGHFQANQILTAQSAALRSTRNTPSTLPIVFRNFTGANQLETTGISRGLRATDPIMAIQFRNSARNVPLGTICKLDLLCARSICIARSQRLIEQTICSLARQNSSNAHESLESSGEPSTSSQQPLDTAQDSSEEYKNIAAGQPIHSSLNQLHQLLSTINHAPLTTSNVHAHITNLRTLLNTILTTLTSMFRSREEGSRLTSMIHDISNSLTGRSWSIPLGANLDDIRLDVIQTLCIVDLTLHLTRQVQLLQMQRVSAIARIEESRRTTNLHHQSVANRNESSVDENHQNEPQIVASSSGQGTSSKRKDSDNVESAADLTKRVRLAPPNNSRQTQDIEMIDNSDSTFREDSSNAPVNNQSPIQSGNSFLDFGQSGTFHGSMPEPLPADRLVIWNSSQNQSMEQSLQRFLMAANLSNSHILVRIYHRLHGNGSSQDAANHDGSPDRFNSVQESRRRALSQDNFASQTDSHEGPAESSSRTLPNTNASSGNAGAANSSLNLENWPRHPHLHVYRTRGPGHHLWFNQWTIPLPVSHSNYRIQCWDFSISAIPSIKDPHLNVVTHKCRIHNDSSIDISGDGGVIACLVPKDDGSTCLPSFDLKVFSLRASDFGACYYQLAHGPNAISVSLSPSASYAVVGLANQKFMSNTIDENLTIAKVFKLDGGQQGHVRDIKIKRDDASLNAIRWMSRGIVYNVGPQHHQRYQAARMRNRNA